MNLTFDHNALHIDVMQLYRVILIPCGQGTKLPNPSGNTLYDFWRDIVTNELQELVGADGIVVNCASQEYAKAVGDIPMLAIAFPGPAIYAKQARGAMVRFAMQNRVTDVEALKQFTGVVHGVVYRGVVYRGVMYRVVVSRVVSRVVVSRVVVSRGVVCRVSCLKV